MSDSPRFTEHDLSVTIPMVSSECRRLYQDLKVSWRVVSDGSTECRLQAGSRKSFDAGRRSWEKGAPSSPRSSARRVDLCITRDGAVVLDDGESYRIGHLHEAPTPRVRAFEDRWRPMLEVLSPNKDYVGGYREDLARSKHQEIVRELGTALAAGSLWPGIASLGNGRVACQLRVELGPPSACPPLQILPFHLVLGASERSIGLSHALAVAPLRNLEDPGERSCDSGGETADACIWVASPPSGHQTWASGRASIEKALLASNLSVASSPAEVPQSVFLFHGPNDSGKLTLDQSELLIAHLLRSIVDRRKAPLEVAILNSCDSNAISELNEGPLDLLKHARIVVATFGKLPPKPSELCAYDAFIARFLADYMGGGATAGEAMLAARMQDAQRGSLAWQHYCLYGDVDTTWGGNPRLTNQ